MIDTFLKSMDFAAINQIRSFATNVIGPTRGRIASVDADGNEIPAAGDPAYWYVCVRFFAPIEPFGNVEACREVEGREVCGVWA